MSTYSLTDSYRHYVANGGELHKSMYKNICQDFNIRIMEHIIYEAGTFNMGSNLSTLSIMRLRRNYDKPVVDWHESNKNREELLKKGETLYSFKTGKGVKWLIYHTGEWYCRFYWKRKSAKFKNKTVYMFIPTRGEKGNKTKLINHLRKNDINYVKYYIGGQ